MTVILVRHGRSTANTAGVLAGRSPSIELDERGQLQARDLADRLTAHLPDGRKLAGIVRSPLLRCEQTVAPLVAATALTEIVDERLIEVDYGDWTGQKIKDLLSDPLWRVVQRQPSAVVFPSGEALAAVQSRAVSAIRERDRAITSEFGPGALWIACSHGDVIKAVIADAYGMHLDLFQRIVVNPASASVISYGEDRPFVHCVNTVDAAPAMPPAHVQKDAVVGGDRGGTAK